MPAVPYGTVYPSYQAAYKGSRVYIECFSRSPVKWTKIGQPLLNPRIVGNTLWIMNADRQVSGVYLCRGHTLRGFGFNATAHILVGGNHNRQLFINYYANSNLSRKTNCCCLKAINNYY